MRHAFFAMTALLAAASASFGAAWTTPAGSNSSFSYTNGHDGNGLFGDGSANTGGFNFSPTTYVATSSNGVFAIVNDEVSVEVFAAPGKTITGVSAHLLGDFTIFGTGGANKLNAPLTIINYSDSNAVAATPIVYTGLPVTTTTSANGIFEGNGSIALLPGTTHIRISLPVFLNASSDVGSSSLNQLKDVSITVTTAVPEPTALLASLAGVGVFIRRRK